MPWRFTQADLGVQADPELDFLFDNLVISMQDVAWEAAFPEDIEKLTQVK